MRKKKRTCLALFSGGLDSMLAIKLMEEQGIKVIPINFNIGFFFNSYKKDKKGKLAYKGKLPSGMKVEVVDIHKDFFKVLKNPKFGYGQGMNPCIDCKILMLKKAKSLMKKYKADFIITGEVIGQRPMTQNVKAMKLIEEESKLQGLILRPLSARRLKKTIPEREDWVRWDKLLSLAGRQRKIQLILAKKFKIEEYVRPPAGGCILTDKAYSEKLRDYIEHTKTLTEDDALLLTIGRHFRKDGIKFIIGRNKRENEELLKYVKKNKKAVVFDCKDVVGPVGITFDKLNEKMKKYIASAVAGYSDGKDKKTVEIEVSHGRKKEKLKVKPEKIERLKEYRVNKDL